MEAPKNYVDAGTMTIISGVLNVLTGFVWMISLIWVCVGIMWVVPMGVGIWQVVVGMAMSKGTHNSSAKWIGIAGAVAALFNMNPLAGVTAVLAALKVREPEVAGYIEGS